MKSILTLSLFVVIYCDQHQINAQIIYDKVKAAAVELVLGEVDLAGRINNLNK